MASATSPTQRGSMTRDTDVRLSAEWVSFTHWVGATFLTGCSLACMGPQAGPQEPVSGNTRKPGIALRYPG